MRTSIFARVALAAVLAVSTLGAKCSWNGGSDPIDRDEIVGATFDVTLTLRTTAAAPSTQYVFGEPIVFAIEARNHSSGVVQLHFADGQVYDVIVAHQTTGQVVWRWSDNRAFTQAQGSVTYSPQSSKTYNVTWDGQLSDGSHLPPGDYDARALLTVDGFEGDGLSNRDFGSPPVDFAVF